MNILYDRFLHNDLSGILEKLHSVEYHEYYSMVHFLANKKELDKFERNTLYSILKNRDLKPEHIPKIHELIKKHV